VDAKDRFDSPLFNENRMKLGVMAINCSHGSTVTTAENTWPMTWADNVALARMVDDAGFEALLPVGRWRGYGGATNFNHRTFESFTWAAGIAALTRRIAVIATVHVPLVHPVAAAKQAVTVDHISGGRFVLNMVCGWNRPEFEMFGAEWRAHDERYEYAAEWLELVRRLWTEAAEFDFDGRWFQGKRLWSQPKPVQRPYPLLMNAGGSAIGQRFSATHCDMNFAMLRQKDRAHDQQQVQSLKRMAAAHGNRSECWIHAYVVCRETQREAEDYLDYYVRQKGDWEAADNMIEMFGIQSETLEPAQLEAFRYHFIAGHGGYPLVGTPRSIVEQIEALSAVGVDGMLLSWVEHLKECRQWIEEVLPLMEAAGQRRPFRPAA
jgi:alkanesulfonate monooxygenase SsuD/methylene tetrahydromethanopterin reductase-like flavin-dependent oxidoreductase (luciferase family)